MQQDILVMRKEEFQPPKNYQEQLEQEYKKAKDNGFNGSLLEYLNLRDFT